MIIRWTLAILVLALIALGGCLHDDANPTPTQHRTERRALVETTPVRVDTLLAREGNAPTATVAQTPTPVPATPAAEATAPVDDPYGICRPEFAWDCHQMLYIVWRESRGDPLAYNETPIYNAGVENHTVCLFQLAMPLHERFFSGDWRDPEVCIQAAYALWDEQGYQPWVLL